jgi:hypothetical protein
MNTLTPEEPTAAEVVIYTKAMQRIDALLGNPIRLINSREEYEAQREELAELLMSRVQVFA